MELLKLSLAVLAHPVETFEFIKSDRNNFSAKPAAILLTAMIAARIMHIYAVHYPLAVLEPRDANIWFEILKFLLPILTWVLATYMVTTILGGEALFGEILTAAAYSMAPYTLFAIPLGILSHLLSGKESALYGTLHAIIWIWVVLLYVLSVKSLHDFSMAKTIGICLLSIFAMLIIWAVALLVFALTSQLYKFFEGIAIEVMMLFSS